ncbi:MAG: 6-bladed beta-propeller [Nitrososphaerales archaeon]
MKIQTAAIVLTVLLASIFTSSQSVTAYSNNYSLTVQIDKSTYIQGEMILISGTISPLRDKVPVMIEILDPSADVRVATEIVPEPNEDNIGLYSYQIKLSKDAPVGIWTINAKYASEYMLYDRTDLSFRVSDSIDILASPFLQLAVDGVIDSGSGEWAHKYDSKYWKPFEHDQSEIEGNIAFNAYYSNGVLYAIFDVPDKKFGSKDFVELGLDINNVADKFKTGDEVYIFRIFRDGKYDSFRLGTENFDVERSAKHQFSAKAEEAGDIRLQVFDEDGNLVKVFDSLRDKSSTSYKGMLGIAGIEIDLAGNLYVLDSDSGMVSKFNPEGRLLGSFGSLGTDFKEFIDPTGIALDSEGSIYVADTGNARVQKFDRQGKFMGAFGSMGLLSIGMAEAGYQKPEENKRHELFESPEAIVVGLSGDLYVVDRRTGEVNIFDSDGNYINSFGSMVSPRGIATDTQGNIYVVEQGNNRVLKFDQSGNMLKKWGAFGSEDGMFKAPYGIAIDSSDSVYVAESVNNRIQKFTSDGKFITKWGIRGMEAGQFVGPHGLAIDSSDNLYVVDTGNHRIQKFSQDGKFVGEFGSKGYNSGNFISPEAIAIDSHGDIYVTDFYNKRVQKFNSDGRFVAEWGSEGLGAGEFRGPFGITIDASDSIYVVDPFNRRVQKFDTSGNLLLRWGSSDIKEAPSIENIPKGEHYIAFDTDSHEPVGVIEAELVEEHGRGAYIVESGLTWKILHIFKDTIYVKPVSYVRNDQAILSWTPDGIDVDPYGNVYIVDRENEIAKKFDSDGRLVSKWGSTGSGDGEFSKPTAMAIDSQNNLYIVDTGNNRIQKFDSDGNFISVWGTLGQGTSQFYDPRGIAVDSQDNVYVLDNGNNRVQKFDSDGNFIIEWGSKGSSARQFDNPSTEGIAVDAQGRVYVADLPGEAKATHWIAEVAIPLFAKSDTFGIYLAEGIYDRHMPQSSDNPNAVKVYDVYRSSWPAGAISILPETWAKATLIDADEMKVEPRINIDKIRACTDQVCSELDQSKLVLTGSTIIVTASIAAEKASDKFEYDRTKVTLQYSLDGEEWIDAESKFVQVSNGVPGAVNLKWIPLDSADIDLRVTSSGLLTKESTSDLVNLKVQESESFQIRADMKWSPSKIMQDEPAAFELAFTSTDNNILNNLIYDLTIVKAQRAVADLPLLHAEDGKSVYKYTFKQPGLHIVQVRIIGIGSSDDFIPVKKVFNYKIDVLPVDSPVQISTIQKGESMRIMIKNRDISSANLNSITLSLADIDKINFRLPHSWTNIVNTEAKTIQFTTEDDPLKAGENMKFTVSSKLFAKSLYNVCWDLQQSTLVVKLC